MVLFLFLTYLLANDTNQGKETQLALAYALSRVTSCFFVFYLSDTALWGPEPASCSRRRQLSPVTTIIQNNGPSFVIVKQFF